MKFSEVFEENIINEWKEFYINYQLMKKLLHPIIREYKERKHRMLFKKEELSEKLVTAEYDISIQESYRDQFLVELEKCEFFYRANIKFYNARLNKIVEQLEYVKANPKFSDKLDKLELALKELYKEINLMRSYIQINLKAKSKLKEKFNIYTSYYTNKLNIQNSIEKYIDNVGFREFNRNLISMGINVDNIFSCYYTIKYKNNSHKILKDSVTPTYLTGKQSFYFGFLNGISFILIIFCTLVADYNNIDFDEDPEFKAIFPMFRGYAITCMYMWLLAINVYAWEIAHVNYKLCFQFKSHYSHFISILTRVSILTSVFVLMILCYLVLRTHIPMLYETFSIVPINMTPLICWIVFIVLILLPVFNPKGMMYTYKLLLESLFISTDFRHVWFLDQLTSFIGPLRDIEYTLCYYSHYDQPSFDRPNICNSNRPIVLFIGIFPHFFRTLQCIRIVINNGLYPQIFNMGKYIFAMLVAVFSFLVKFNPAYDILWLITAVISTIYSTYWDIKFDFGFLEKGKNYPLREKLSYKKKYFYYFVLISNLVFRFIWVLSVSPEVIYGFIRPEFLFLMIYSMEVFRRGMWNFIRVELQHIQLCKEFRVVEYVELPFKKDKLGSFSLRNPDIIEQLIEKQERRFKKLKSMKLESSLDLRALEKRTSCDFEEPEGRRSVLLHYLDDYKNKHHYEDIDYVGFTFDEKGVILKKN
jgi:hypothetical protein